MKYKKIVHSIFAFVLVFIMLSASTVIMPDPIFASFETEPYNWYTKRNKDHTLPTIDSYLEFIWDYNGYYGDKKAAENGDKVIYLTFDAGYENGNVEKVLDALKKHNAPGAFFLLENFILRNPELTRRMVDEGHLICNHTAKHPNMTKITDKARFDLQLSALDEAAIKVTGSPAAKFYRPPEGKFSRQNLMYARDLGYKTILWSFAYADWDNNRQPSEKEAIKLILDNAHPGEIMLLHPTSATNAAILDRVLTELENQGYRFASLNELP